MNDLHMHVNEGDVYGFLGPNGSGKSTTIRMMLSLARPTSGTIDLFGKPLRKHRGEILRRIGAMIEKPDFYGNLTAYRNLRILSIYSKAPAKKQKIMETLEMVGLAHRSHSKVKTFSQGMKQRLGLAQALIHDPDLLVLDEPSNGLDPQGIKDMRELILRLNKELGKTILISSHLLHEIELIANRMLIIENGKTVVEGVVEELLSKDELSVTVEVDDLDKALKMIGESQFAELMESSGGHKMVFKMNREETAAINKYLVEKGCTVHAVVPVRSLEDYFLNITHAGT